MDACKAVAALEKMFQTTTHCAPTTLIESSEASAGSVAIKTYIFL